MSDMRQKARTASVPVLPSIRDMSDGKIASALNSPQTKHNANTLNAPNTPNTLNTPDTSPDRSKASRLKIYYDQVLGKGSFATVYVGEYKSELVAVKIIELNGAKPKLIHQFKREIDVVRILQGNPHPNIPVYHKLHEDRNQNRIIIVMEWCRGGELTQLIKLGLDEVQIKSYFDQLIGAYSHLLSLNIVHRDMKSQNILLSQDLKTIKIIDFGLSKVIRTDMTRTVVGSPAYMAPERLGAEDYDSTSDIWSLGIILYEMIYRANPFKDCRNKKSLIESVNRPIVLVENRITMRARTTAVNGKDEDDDNEDDTVSKDSDKINIVEVTEEVPDYMLTITRGMLNIDRAERFDWEDIFGARTLLMLDSTEKDRLAQMNEQMRLMRAHLSGEKAIPTISSELSGTEKKSDSNSDADSPSENQMFNIEIDGSDILRTERRSTVADSAESDELEGSVTVGITIPARRRTRFGIERSGMGTDNSNGNSVDYDKQLELLDDYFELGGKSSVLEMSAHVSAHASAHASPYCGTPQKRMSGTGMGIDKFASSVSPENEFDASFLDTLPFLQSDYKESTPYDTIKKESGRLGAALYSKSAPMMSGLTNMAKKALGDIK